MRKIIGLSILAAVLTVGCERRSREPNIELIQDMMVSPAVKAQDDDPNSMKLPPEGTIPQGWTPYNMKSPEEAAAKLTNPYEKNMENTLKGQKLFLTFCVPCHGAKADGKGTIAEKWPAAIPALTTQNARNYKDGYIYHIITMGRGLMGSYASQVRPEDRWLIINYLRHVQDNTPVTPVPGATN
jgi:mono/diheme cytochrome c family protein